MQNPIRFKQHSWYGKIVSRAVAFPVSVCNMAVMMSHEGHINLSGNTEDPPGNTETHVKHMTFRCCSRFGLKPGRPRFKFPLSCEAFWVTLS